MSTTARYVVMDRDEAVAAGLDWFSDDWRSVLVDTATTPPTEIAIDHGEPEDNSFYRDWKWVPEKLNELAAENATLRARIAELEGRGVA